MPGRRRSARGTAGSNRTAASSAARLASEGSSTKAVFGPHRHARLFGVGIDPIVIVAVITLNRYALLTPREELSRQPNGSDGSRAAR
jgi:hypothetical protein